MGLDMYLRASRFVSGYAYETDKSHYTALVSQFDMAEFLDPETPTAHVDFTVMYWRKANAIHKWFVTNCQEGIDDCRDADVSRKQLAELRDTCQKVIDRVEVVPGDIHIGTSWRNGARSESYEPGGVIANPDVAAALLPTTDGFFFGGGGYDQYYLLSLRETIDAINRALRLDDEWIFEYHSSW